MSQAATASVVIPTKKLAAEKLESSGLNFEDAEELHITYLEPEETKLQHPSFRALPALKIAYFSPSGEPLTDWPESPPYYRIRYLQQKQQAHDFTALTGKKPMRYVQEPDTAPVAYYPQNIKDWPTICEDSSRPLIVTEGELKAAKACKEGFPTLGLGGVHSWRSNAKGLEWLPSLEFIDWKKRNVYLCWDSDYRANPAVCQALSDFAEELQRRGAFSYVSILPDIPGFEKTGLDDFLTFSGIDARENFQSILKQSPPLGFTLPLWEFNKRYVYVQTIGCVVLQANKDVKIRPHDFSSHFESTVRYREAQLTKSGDIAYKPVSAASAWLEWPLRCTASAITFAPGQPEFVKQESGPPLLNTWQGWGVEPKRSNVDLFTTLVEHLFQGSDPGSMEWFLKWCAYPLQHPGEKLYTSVVIHGTRHGTGKSLVGYTLGAIYGKNFAEITERDLHSQFNAWSVDKQLVLGDDVTGSNKRQDADFLKKLITQKQITINPKYVNSYTIPDRINYFFTANHPDALFLEDDDRRFFVHRVRMEPLSASFYQKYDRWLNSGVGPSAVFEYLLHYPLDGFNPAGRAYETSDKDLMIAIGRSDLGSWVRDLITNPDNILKVNNIPLQSDLFSSADLLPLYDTDGSKKVTANGISRELSRAGVEQVYSGRPLRLADGTQARFFAIRNANYWLLADRGEIVNYLNERRSEKQLLKY